MCYCRFSAHWCHTCAFALTGAHGNATGTPWQPIAPTSPTASTITHPKSSIYENCRLGISSFHVLYLFARFPGPHSLCPLSFSYHRPPCNLNFYQSGYKYGARSFALGPASLSTAICPATGVLPVLYISGAHLSLLPLSVWLQVRCSLSASPMRISPFHRYLSGYRCIARSFPL